MTLANGGWVMEWFLGAGSRARDLVLQLADLLRQPDVPGWVVIGLAISLLIAITHLIIKTKRQRSALLWLRSTVEKVSNQASLSENIAPLSQSVNDWAKKGGAATPEESVAVAWREYAETLVPHEQDGRIIMRNAVRPGIFFNQEDLHFAPGFWRILPGLFVTIGLFLTFLGLISALGVMSHDMDQGGQLSVSAMSDLLKVASAKFIMSLTGLICSILFTILLRYRMGLVEHAINSLNQTIEGRLSFISLEDLAVEQLRTLREQKDHFRLIGMELVAELGRPLREELPQAVSASISTAMKPLVEQMTQMGTDGMEGMVKDLSGRFSSDVARALEAASSQIREAGSRIGDLAARMDQSSGRMGSELQGVIDRLARSIEEMQSSATSNANITRQAFGEGAEKLLSAMQQSLEDIQINTREGAKAISDSAEGMRLAAISVREQMAAAAEQGAAAAKADLAATGAGIQSALGDAAASVTAVLKGITERTAEAFLDPIEQINAKMRDVSDTLGGAVADIRRLSDSIRDGALATGSAADSLRGSSQSLVSAIEPVRATTSSIEHAIRSLADSTAHVAATSRSNIDSSKDTLAAAEQALGGQRQAIEAAMTGIGAALERLHLQGTRIDDIDQKLGAAFGEYKVQVESAVASLFEHVRKMQEELAPALGTMREIVEQAERFMPQQQRNA